jgi:hypothetical protein
VVLFSDGLQRRNLVLASKKSETKVGMKLLENECTGNALYILHALQPLFVHLARTTTMGSYQDFLDDITSGAFTSLNF